MEKRKFLDRVEWSRQEAEAIIFLLSGLIICLFVWSQEVFASILTSDLDYYHSYWTFSNYYFTYFDFFYVLFWLWLIIIFYYGTLEIIRIFLVVRINKEEN